MDQFLIGFIFPRNILCTFKKNHMYLFYLAFYTNGSIKSTWWVLFVYFFILHLVGFVCLILYLTINLEDPPYQYLIMSIFNYYSTAVYFSACM